MCKGKKKWFHIYYDNKKVPPKDVVLYIVVVFVYKLGDKFKF